MPVINEGQHPGPLPKPAELGVKDKIVVQLGLAQVAVQRAYELATEENSLAAELDVFKDIKATVFGLGEFIQRVQKLRFK
jgi:hypothetical protein